jgi:hypothetical protein
VATLTARLQAISPINAENPLLFPRLKTVVLPIIRSHSEILMGKHDVKTVFGNRAIHDASIRGAEQDGRSR